MGKKWTFCQYELSIGCYAEPYKCPTEMMSIMVDSVGTLGPQTLPMSFRNICSDEDKLLYWLLLSCIQFPPALSYSVTFQSDTCTFVMEAHADMELCTITNTSPAAWHLAVTLSTHPFSCWYNLHMGYTFPSSFHLEKNELPLYYYYYYYLFYLLCLVLRQRSCPVGT